MPSPVVQFDSEKKIVFYNSAAIKQFGVDFVQESALNIFVDTEAGQVLFETSSRRVIMAQNNECEGSFWGKWSQRALR